MAGPAAPILAVGATVLKALKIAYKAYKKKGGKKTQKEFMEQKKKELSKDKNKLKEMQDKAQAKQKRKIGDPEEKFTEGEALAKEARREARKKKVDKFRRKIGMDEFEENPGLPRNMRNNNQIKMKRYAARKNRQAKILAEKKKKSLMGGSDKMYGETF